MTTGFANGASHANSANNATDAGKTHCVRFIDHNPVATDTDVAAGTNAWYSINDNVMGGKSSGSSSENGDHLRFFGSINTDGGGFASIRHDISASQFMGADRIRLAVQSDGRTYSVQLQDESNRQLSTSHRAPILVAASNEYEVIEVLFKDFVPTFRGRQIQSDPFSTATASTIGIMISDAIDGPFNLKLRWIEVCHIKE